MLKLFSNSNNADIWEAHLVKIILNKEKAERAVVTPSSASYAKSGVSEEDDDNGKSEQSGDDLASYQQ